MLDIVRFALANQSFKPLSEIVDRESYKEMTMVSKTWGFERMDGLLQAERGWYCDNCHTTFFVADPMTQLIHDCMKERGFPSQS